MIFFTFSRVNTGQKNDKNEKSHIWPNLRTYEEGAEILGKMVSLRYLITKKNFELLPEGALLIILSPFVEMQCFAYNFLISHFRESGFD